MPSITDDPFPIDKPELADQAAREFRRQEIKSRLQEIDREISSFDGKPSTACEQWLRSERAKLRKEL